MLDKKQQQYLSKFIADNYESPEELANYLDMSIEMFFYLEDSIFDKEDIQSIVFGIRGIRNALRGEKK